MLNAQPLGRYILGVALVALFAADLPSHAKADQPAPNATVTVMGSVIDQHNGLPIPGASLELQRAIVVVARATSDQTGAFRFPPQPRALYTIVARATGYS